jgi:hypothetical protein
VKTATTRWRNDVERGGEVAASDRPGGDGRIFKGVRRWRRCAQRPPTGGPGGK